jgi:hypothetical protein
VLEKFNQLAELRQKRIRSVRPTSLVIHQEPAEEDMDQVVRFVRMRRRRKRWWWWWMDEVK